MYTAGLCNELVWVQSWFMYRVSWFMYTDLVYALVNLQSWCMYRVGLCTEMVYGQSWFMY